MYPLACSGMRVWISCLLIGSITCGPVGKEYVANGEMSFMRWPSSASSFSGVGVSSDPGSSSPLPGLPNPSYDEATEQLAPQDALSSAGPGSYSSSPGVYSSPNMAVGNGFASGYASSPEVREYEVAYAAPLSTGYGSSAPGGSYGGGYGSSASAYAGDGSSGFVAAPRDENWSSGSANGYGDENPEPVFSDVSDLEPVYSFSSRSSYQRGRAVFAQTRYTPGEPVPLRGPVARRTGKTSPPSSPAKAAPKGGF